MASVENAECSGHPVTSKTDENVDQVREPVFENRITIYKVANYCCLGCVIQNLITNISKSKTK
jgi:hypothetical protein